MAARTPRSQSRAADGGGLTPAVQRFLEQRLDADRRVCDQRLKALDRRMEDFTAKLPSFGRVAGLQGDVDGLSEQIQEIRNRVDDVSFERPRPPGMKTLCAPETPMFEPRFEAFEQRLQALEVPKLEVPNGIKDPKGITGVHSEFELRLGKVETAVEAIGGWDGRSLDALKTAAEATKESLGAQMTALKQRVNGSTLCLAQNGELQKQITALRTDLEDGLRSAASSAKVLETCMDELCCKMDKSEQIRTPLSVAGRVKPSEEGEPGEDADRFEGFAAHMLEEHTRLAEQVANLLRRLQQAERGVWGSAESRDLRQLQSEVCTLAERFEHLEQDCGAGSDQESRLEEVCENIVADLRSELEDQSSHMGDLDARLRDAEATVFDMAETQQVQQHTDRVGERMLGLTMRLQRVERGQDQEPESLYSLRDELGEAGEAIVAVRSRLEQTEHGLEGIAEAFGRICDELAELRGRAPDARRRHRVDAAVSDDEVLRLERKIKALEADLVRMHDKGAEVTPEHDEAERTPRAPQGPEHALGEEEGQAKFAECSKFTFNGYSDGSVAELLAHLRNSDGNLYATVRALWALAEVVCDLPRPTGAWHRVSSS